MENVIAVTSSTSPDPGIVEAVGRELDRMSKNALVFTNERGYVNAKLDDFGYTSLVKGEGIKGLVHDVKDKLRVAIEKAKGQSQGMRL